MLVADVSSAGVDVEGQSGLLMAPRGGNDCMAVGETGVMRDVSALGLGHGSAIAAIGSCRR